MGRSAARRTAGIAVRVCKLRAGIALLPFRMPFIAMNCPRCAGPLPRSAYWRTVTCPWCGVTVGQGAKSVKAAEFREAHRRVLAASNAAGEVIQCGSRRYRVLAHAGHGEHCDVYVAERIAPMPERVTLKVARAGTAAAHLKAQAATLDALQALGVAGAAYFTQRFPQVRAVGHDGVPGDGREVLVLRSPTGYWGSGEDVIARCGGSLDPRHLVWLWRRVLESLGFLHGAGWTHGDVIPAHLLVHPANHGVMLIGWSQARRVGRAESDLMQSARSMSAIAEGASLPQPLDALLRQAGGDAAWCRAQGAAGIDAALRQAAERAFGPPRFILFNPAAQTA